MNTSNLKVGMVIPNYNKLCKLLEVEPKKGSGRNKMISDFERYFTWEKDKNAFIIKKIHRKPRAFTESEMIDLLMLHLLLTSEHPEPQVVISTKRNLYERLSIVNPNYRYCLSNPKQAANYKDIPEGVVKETMKLIDDSLDNKLKSSLNRLAQRKILFANEIYMICKIKEISDGDNINNINEHRPATDEEIKTCLRVERDTLKTLNCITYKDAFTQGKQYEYSKLVKEKLLAVGVLFFYRAVKIVFLDKEIPSVVDEYLRKYKLSQSNHCKYINSVNKTTQLNILTNAENRHSSALKSTLNVQPIVVHDTNKYNVDTLIKLGVLNEDCDIDSLCDENGDCIPTDAHYTTNTEKLIKMRADNKYIQYVEKLIALTVDNSTPLQISDISKCR